MTKAENDKLMEELDHFDTENLQPLVDIIDEYSYPIKQLMSLIQRIDAKHEHYVQLLSFCDSAREDITHHLEFDRNSAIMRNKLLNKQIDVLKVRRMVKTHLACIQCIRDGWLLKEGPAIYQKCAKIMASIDSLEKQRYTDRTTVVEDLLNGGEGDG